MKKKVVIAMSGGVDSSVTAALLKQAGYDCIGMHLQFWVDPLQNNTSEEIAKNKCCTLQGLEDARHVARLLNIPFYVMNVIDSFKEQVVDYYLKTYAAGKTPNPCIECNRNIKFGQLLKRASELGADFLASGHYARVVKSSCGYGWELFAAQDKAKDQSYFLYHLTQEKLSRILFPLGNLLKTEVYALAQEFGLTRVAEKDESQGLCFFSESKPLYFLKRYLPKKFFEPGPIITMHGLEIGCHRGLPLYTIGQRKGLGIGGIKGEPEGFSWYVSGINPSKNALIVGRAADAFQESFVCQNLDFISGEVPKEPIAIEVRVRHRAALVSAQLEVKEDRGYIFSAQPIMGIAPGQAAVFYQGEKLLGGGIIEAALPVDKYKKLMQNESLLSSTISTVAA